METSFRFGRVAGIEIGANWSLIVVAWLILWGLAGEILPTVEPGHSTAAYWAVGALAVLLFFVGLVTHELGHSLVARRYGVEVKQITLWLFGGVAKLESDTTSAAAELRIAVAGPIVSLVLGLVFAGLSAALYPVPSLELIAASLAWLATINLLLAGFNLLPAFPLDGGRVLRAYLWHRSGSRLSATLTAAQAGQFFGYALIGLGIFAFASGAGLGGIWFVFIGWFLLAASRAEAGAVTQQDLLAGLKVAQVMSADPIAAPVNLSVAQLIDTYLFRYRHSVYPVVDADGRPQGLVTLETLRAVPLGDRATTPLSVVAFPMSAVPVAGPDDLVSDLVPRLMSSRPGRALVLSDDRLVGIVSSLDIARALDLRALWKGVSA